MSELSELVEKRQQRLNEAEQSTKKAVEAASERIVETITRELSAAESSCSAAMDDHKRSVRRQIKMTWLPLWLCCLLIIGLMGGVMYWQMNTILDQREALARLKDQGSEIQLNQCKTANGKSLLCVKIDRSRTGWGNWMIPEGY